LNAVAAVETLRNRESDRTSESAAVRDTQLAPPKVGAASADVLRETRVAASRATEALRPKVAVDTVLFAMGGARLKCYLVQLQAGALTGRWAFPGGLVRVGETLDSAARREIEDAAGLRDIYLEQVFSFGDPSRDPDAHVVSVAYMALIPDASAARLGSRKYASGQWFEMERLPALAYDHREVARFALERLRSRLRYMDIARNLLPPTFTMGDLHDIYQSALERGIDRRNFRRWILTSGLLKSVPGKRRGAHRPATIYAFRERSDVTFGMI
jgi:8-oxo-dGTP diphosphatase